MRIYLSLGSNLGDRKENLQNAITSLGAEVEIQIASVSSFYETPPWGKTDQPPFLNAATAVDTSLSPIGLLSVCQAIELAGGRIRHEKWGARTLDIDLVYSPDTEWHSETLQLPHPYLTQRAFVLVPLQELDCSLMIEGRPIDYWLNRLTDVQQIIKVE